MNGMARAFANSGFGYDAHNDRPNILLLFADQHNANALGCYGNPIVKTPNLDCLAVRGMRFNRHYCADGICIASRTAMMTGLYPRTTGVLTNGDNPVHPDLYPVLQQMLQQAGYRTASFGKRHLADGLRMGWNESATTISPKQDPSQESYWDWLKQDHPKQWQAHLRDWDKNYPGGAFQADLMCLLSEVDDRYRAGEYVAEQTRRFLRQAKQDGKPFFCWSSILHPHQPYTPTRRWAELYPIKDMVLPPNVRQPIDEVPPLLEIWRRRMRPPWDCGKAAEHPEIYQRYIAYYYALVSETDHYVGEIVDELERLGLDENTFVIYSSDHGDFVAHHGMVEKCSLGHNVYEDTLRVPFIVSWPKRFRQKTVCDGLSTHLDFVPTIMELTGATRDGKASPLPGQSLIPTLVAGTPPNRDCVFSENWSQVSAIGEQYKLGHWIDPTAAREQWDYRSFGDMMFNRRADPMEVQNIYGQISQRVEQERLRDRLTNWEKHTSAFGKNELVAQRRSAADAAGVSRRSKSAT
jgi:arylsulfatase A-like enzyme